MIRYPQKIYPTDIINTHCVYDTSERTKPTFSGISSDQEMCYGFFLYYPYSEDVQMCTSKPIEDVGDGTHECNMPGDENEYNYDFGCHAPKDFAVSDHDEFGRDSFDSN